MLAVCQPSVPVLAAVAVMEADDDPYVPRSMVLMGGPIDTRVNPTVVNRLAEERGIEWFRRNVITKVPFPNPGFMRDVYPGFLQLHGFMSMNLDRHIEAHRNLFQHLVSGDGELGAEASGILRRISRRHGSRRGVLSADRRDRVHSTRLAEGRDDPSRTARSIRPRSGASHCSPSKARHDDISGVGQTEAAHRLCENIPADRRAHWLQPGVGHYGVFNGSRFRSEIVPRIADFVLSNNFDPQTRSSRRVGAAAKANGSARPGPALPAPTPGQDEGQEPSPGLAPR